MVKTVHRCLDILAIFLNFDQTLLITQLHISSASLALQLLDESAIRLAVALGGDADTQAAIAGGIADS